MSSLDDYAPLQSTGSQVAHVGIVGYVFSRNDLWWLAGLAGVIVGSVWNYAVSSVFTWKDK